MARAWLLVVGLVLAPAPARPQSSPTSPPISHSSSQPAREDHDPKGAAASFLNALAVRDEAAMAGVLSADLDPFLVADALLGMQVAPAERAFAVTPLAAACALADLVKNQKANQRLPELVLRWGSLDARALADEARLRATLAKALAANAAQRWGETLELVAGLPRDAETHAPTLTGARLRKAAADALSAQGRHEDAASAYRAASERAESLGWSRFAAVEALEEANEAIARGDHGAAIPGYQRAVALERLAGNRARVADLLQSVGHLHLSTNDLDGALEHVEAARKELRELGEPGRAAQILFRFAKQEDARGATARALAHCKEARNELVAAGLADDAALCLCETGKLLKVTGKSAQAIEVFARSEQELAKCSDRRGQAEALQWLGSACLETSRFGAARESFERALSICESEGMPDEIAKCLGSLGSVRLYSGDYSGARDFFERALSVNRAQGDRKGAATALSSLGLCHELLGDLARAASLGEQALAEQEALDDRDGLTATLGHLGPLYAQFGQREKALAYLRRLVRLEEKGKDLRGLAVALGTEANVLDDAGRSDEALANHRRALEICEQIGERSGAATSLSNIGWCQLRRSELEPAQRHFELARDRLDELGDRNGAALARSNLAMVLARRGHFAEGLVQLQQARPDLEDSGYLDGLCSVLANLAESHLRLGHHAEALAAARDFQKTKLQIASGLGEVAGRVQQELLPRAAEVVLVCARALLPAAPPASRERLLAEAFAAVEAARALQLAQSLEGKGKLLATKTTPSLVAGESAARAAVQQARQRLAAAAHEKADPERLAGARHDLAAAYQSFEDAVARVHCESVAVATELALPQPTELGEVQRRLAEDTALISYQITRERTFALVVRRGDVALVDLAATQDVRRDAEAWLRVLPNPQSDERALAEANDAALLHPLEPWLAGTRHLLIAPDAVLAFLPFEALLRSEGGKRMRAVERWEIAYVPSATIWRTLANAAAATPRGARLVALGDPLYPGESGALEPSGASSTASRAMSLGGMLPLRRLAASGDEVATLAALFGDEHSVVLRRADATPERLAQAVRGGRLRALHLACHAHFASEQPRLTGLVLADGAVLALDDVCRLDLAADLVVLSACESGRGTFQPGEGVLGLTRAFLCAGALRVVVSAWRVPDQDTRMLMEAFYRKMVAGGLAPTAALRTVKLERLAAGGPSAHPARWAAFVLWGRDG